ncbi:MAG TPA: NAD(P)/FAD-dependent oxidoreductase [Phycisphaerales bacterium]|nr:NAD(P)/FAD-dependent oxidoreductase [Phycisphaerales bacterium]
MGSGARRSVMIVGAGLAGALLGCYLRRQGLEVDIYERRPDPRVQGWAGGRSINLALSARGIRGLAGVGLAERVLAGAVPMSGRMIHGRAGELTFQAYSKNPEDAINSVSRSGLNLVLIEAAQECGARLHFGHRCVDVDLDGPAAVFEVDEAGGVPGSVSVPPVVRRASAGLIVGADGAYSAVRARLARQERFDYSQTYLAHGYKELHIPALTPTAGPTTPAGRFALAPHALHIWPRGGSMMIALPNTDGSFTCTLFWPFEGEHSFAALTTEAEAAAFFAREYPDAPALMPTLTRDFFANPTGSLVTIRCWPWSHAGRVALLGDAAHAIVPFFGQGMNAAFEDVVELDECLRRHEGDRAAGVAAYQRARKPNADAIADMAHENFLEMRDAVGRPEFLYRKRVEQAVHELFPDRVAPLYNLVSFATVPYVEARRRGRELDAVVERVVARVPAARARELGVEAWKQEVRAAAAPVLEGGTRE